MQWQVTKSKKFEKKKVPYGLTASGINHVEAEVTQITFVELPFQNHLAQREITQKSLQLFKVPQQSRQVIHDAFSADLQTLSANDLG